MQNLSRRGLLRAAGASALAAVTPGLGSLSRPAFAESFVSDSLPMQLYKSMNDEQKAQVCLPVDHPRRQFVSNWWYIHRDYRIPGTFDADQQELIQTIFDSLHNPAHQEEINKQVEIDQYGELKNAPAVGFFGTPDDQNFEFIYTGHHVTRRCNAHTDKGQGFGGAPIFYGHFRDEFNETSEHIGNPYWYQGKIFNEFVASLDDKQQQQGLAGSKPRSEKSELVIQKRKSGWPGLRCADLSNQHQELLIETMGKMLGMFRSDDVEASLQTIRSSGMINDLHVSWYDGKFDVGADKVWDTWQIEGPNMVWYFRGQPHIHSYFHLKNA